MRRKGPLIPVFIFLFLLSLFLFSLSRNGLLTGIAGFFEQITIPLTRWSAGFTSNEQPSELDKLRAENGRLLIELAKQKEIEKENKALRDQFETAKPVSRSLLPVRIIGRRPNVLIIDKGMSDSVKKGAIVLYKDNLIGVIQQVSQHASVVSLISAADVSFTAETVKTKTAGVIKGAEDNEFLFGDVTLSDKLEKGDVVVTKGDRDDKGQGFSPGFVIGKIISVNKKASDLFQTAEVRSLVDFNRLDMVFVFGI